MNESRGNHSQNGAQTLRTSEHQVDLAPATIGFRLEIEARAELASRAKALGVSSHDLARHYVLQMLHDTDERREVRNAILALRQEMIELRKDVSVSTEALLTSAGKIAPGEARSWTRQNLKTN